MIKYFLQIHIPYLKENMETIAAFSSGSILTLGYWLAIDPTAIMMSAVLGLAGGFGGLLAKAICNKVTRYFKNRNKKS